MRKRTPIVIRFAMLAAILVALLCISTRQKAVLRVTVSFTGYTNDAAGTRIASFKVTNRSKVKVRRWYFCHQETERYIASGDIAPTAYLASGRSEVIQLPAPTNWETWRIKVFFSPVGWRLLISECLWQLPDGILRRILPARLEGNPFDYQCAQSDWIHE